MSSFVIHIEYLKLLRKIIVIVLSMIPTYAFAIPDWAKTRTGISSGNKYSVVCSGTGPSVDLARNDSLRKCKASAVELFNSNMSVRSVVIESEQSVSYHKQIDESFRAVNVSCKIEKEDIFEQKDGGFEVWLLCAFDLNTIEGAEEETQNEILNKNNSIKEEKNKDLSKINSIGNQPVIPKEKKEVSKERYALTLIIISGCDDLLVTGVYPRTIMCHNNNFITLLMYKSDESILIRSEGYLPKTITLDDSIRRKNEAIRVILNRQ